MHIGQTLRLSIRQFELSDDEFILTLTNQSSYKRYIGDRNLHTLDDARNYLNTVILNSYQTHGFGLYRVADKNTDQALGMAGLIKRPELEQVDLGFAFLSEYCRQGYAFEASRFIMNQACETHRLDHLLAITTPDNRASIALLEKLQFQFLRQAVLFANEPALNIYQHRSA